MKLDVGADQDFSSSKFAFNYVPSASLLIFVKIKYTCLAYLWLRRRLAVII